MKKYILASIHLNSYPLNVFDYLEVRMNGIKRCGSEYMVICSDGQIISGKFKTKVFSKDKGVFRLENIPEGVHGLELLSGYPSKMNFGSNKKAKFVKNLEKNKWIEVKEYLDIYNVECRNILIYHYNLTSLHVAAFMGKNNEIDSFLKTNERALDEKVSFSFHEAQSPLEFAALGGELETFQLLLSYNNMTLSGYQKVKLLSCAIEGQNLKLVKYIIRDLFNNKFNFKNNELLIFQAAQKGTVEIMDYLRKMGADLNALTEDNETVLHYAAKSENLEMIKYFRRKGVNVEVMTNNNETILHYAAKSGNKNIVAYFYKEGLNCNQKTLDGLTALHYALQVNNVECFHYLLDKTDLEIKDNNGRTFFDYCFSDEHLEVVKYLYYNKKIADLKNIDNNTILHLKKQRKSKKIIQFLESVAH